VERHDDAEDQRETVAAGGAQRYDARPKIAGSSTSRSGSPTRLELFGVTNTAHTTATRSGWPRHRAATGSAP
jgi:hypothetical protein